MFSTWGWLGDTVRWSVLLKELFFVSSFGYLQSLPTV